MSMCLTRTDYRANPDISLEFSGCGCCEDITEEINLTEEDINKFETFLKEQHSLLEELKSKRRTDGK